MDHERDAAEQDYWFGNPDFEADLEAELRDGAISIIEFDDLGNPTDVGEIPLRSLRSGTGIAVDNIVSRKRLNDMAKEQLSHLDLPQGQKPN